MSAVLKAEEEFRWTPVEIGGRGYLSTEEIARFYKLKLRPREGRQVVFDTPKVVMRMEVGSTECTMNGMKFILETPVVESDAAAFVSQKDLVGLLDPVLRPGMIKNAGDFTTVIFDPVGGGEDPAAAGERGTVSDPSLEVALHAAKDLESRGIKVVLTREDGTGLTAGERLERVTAVDGKAVFIRIDLNPGAVQERGIRAAPLGSPAVPPASGESFGAASMALASGIHGSVLRGLGKHGVDRGIKSLDDPELHKIRHPVVIFTSGSLKNPYDARLMADEGYRKALARGIVMGVLKYRSVTSK